MCIVVTLGSFTIQADMWERITSALFGFIASILFIYKRIEWDKKREEEHKRWKVF